MLVTFYGSTQEFLSTPSARRATYGRTNVEDAEIISIHALREEGDQRRSRKKQSLANFYPRPPRGGRLIWTSITFSRQIISIHALREEGDDEKNGEFKEDKEFLSTPSARRATAKTETKSLFSNKLYNILHEFRRALIYNGSKNYPNHAK